MTYHSFYFMRRPNSFLFECENEVKNGISTTTNSTHAIIFESILLKQLSEVQIRSSKAKGEIFKFSIETHTIGNYDPKWIGKEIHGLTGD